MLIHYKKIGEMKLWRGIISCLWISATLGSYGDWDIVGLPRLELLRRQVKFIRGRWPAHITIITLSTEKLRVRWFKQAHHLPHAEIRNMIQIYGDPDFRESHISSGEVTAFRLHVHGLRHFPTKFVTVISCDQHNFQYLVTTIVTGQSHRLVLDRSIDSIHWIKMPKLAQPFGYDRVLRIGCSVVLDSESMVHVDELHMYHMARVKNKATEMSIGKIHRERDNYVEKAGRFLYAGTRTPLPLNYTSYDVSVTAANASRLDEGVYVCGIERAADKASVYGIAQEFPNHFMAPEVEILPCEHFDTYNRNKQIITLTTNKQTCIRCRAFGIPTPHVVITKANRTINSDDHSHVSTHINVPDGGVVEVTYTIHRPDKSLHGASDYQCQASNHKHGSEKLYKHSIKFELSVK